MVPVKQSKLKNIHDILLKQYGPQGWWPLLELDDGIEGEKCTSNNKSRPKNKGCNPTKTGSINGYHPGDYSYPKTEAQKFEICVGAILTQNTSWPNVEKALLRMQKKKAVNPKAILVFKDDELTDLIRPAGYFNQKCKKLKIFSAFYITLEGRTPTRDQLLSVWGIGPETADSILLYAYKVPVFVVDAYTKRVFSELRLIKKDADYEDIRMFFEKALPHDIKIYQEFHALIVEHAKRYYSKKPYGQGCNLRKFINK